MKENLRIRQEKKDDRPIVFELIRKAFEEEKMSDHNEHFLVNELKTSSAFIPELSLVAEREKRLVGYILLTKILIRNEYREYPSLALAPVAVLPEFQNKGIGTQLIKAAHKIAMGMGYGSVILLGHAEYYPRFGYRPAADFHIHFPSEIPEENFMAIELKRGALKNVSGTVVYPPEFGI